VIGPLQDPNEKCATCGHTHDQHSGEDTCGCMLECTAPGCRCSDFIYGLDLILPGVKKE